MKSTVVLGNGFLGKKFGKRGFDVLDRDQFYLTRGKNECMKELEPYDVIINAMGKSNTRWCEERENFNATMFSNAYIPKILSNYCDAEGKKLVHVSTGCLYDRNDVPQKETDFTAAHCNYTVSKWVGEQQCNPDKDLILRPRLYFSDFEDPNNLLCKIPRFKRQLTEQNSLTSLDTIVDATQSLLNADQSGIFNVACDGVASPLEIGRWMGAYASPVTAEELHKSEGLYLVNNIMDLSKLKQFFHPRKLKDAVMDATVSLYGYSEY